MVTDWKVKKLGDIAEIRMCKRIFADQTAPTGTRYPFSRLVRSEKNLMPILPALFMMNTGISIHSQVKVTYCSQPPEHLEELLFTMANLHTSKTRTWLKRYFRMLSKFWIFIIFARMFTLLQRPYSI